MVFYNHVAFVLIGKAVDLGQSVKLIVEGLLAPLIPVCMWIFGQFSHSHSRLRDVWYLRQSASWGRSSISVFPLRESFAKQVCYTCQFIVVSVMHYSILTVNWTLRYIRSSQRNVSLFVLFTLCPLSIIHARHCQQDQQGKVARSVRTGRPKVWQEYLMNTSTERALLLFAHYEGNVLF